MIYFGVGGVAGGLAGEAGFITNPITNTAIAARTIRYNLMPMEKLPPIASDIVSDDGVFLLTIVKYLRKLLFVCVIFWHPMTI